MLQSVYLHSWGNCDIRRMEIGLGGERSATLISDLVTVDKVLGHSGPQHPSCVCAEL